MKLAVWAYTLAVFFASVAVAAMGGIGGNIYKYRFGAFNGKPLPGVTDLLVGSSWWALIIPLPWLFAAVWLSRRGAATPERIFAFAGVSTLAITFLAVYTAIALTFPFFTIIVSMAH